MKEPDEERGWHIEIDIGISSMYVHMHVLGCTVTQNRHAYHFGHTHQWSEWGDLMPNEGRREKGSKCGRLPLNVGELGGLLNVKSIKKHWLNR